MQQSDVLTDDFVGQVFTPRFDNRKRQIVK